MITKQAVRQKASTNLAALLDKRSVYFMQEMVKQITSLPAWQKAETVALTLSQADELPTNLLIQTALLQNKTVVLPRVLPKKQMAFATITQETNYERHPFGMLEPVGGRIVKPEDIDFVLVPGLAFTNDGQRIGFGGGYYDRWLPQTMAKKVAVTIVANVFVTPVWQVEETDQTVDQVIVLDRKIENE